MRIWTLAHITLTSIFSISHLAEANPPLLHNNIGKVLLRDYQKNKIHIGGHVSVKFAKSKDGNLVIPENKPVLPTKHYFPTPISHLASKDEEQFNQTYWVYDKHYKAGGPVFLYLPGESATSDSTAGLILNYTRINDLQKSFGGLGIVLEHRYYGESTPKSAWGPGANKITAKTPTEKFGYLKTDLVLEDIRLFAESFKHSSERVPTGTNLTADQTPWIVIGASYAGNLVSILRKRYPRIFFAGYSSSAPVEARKAMPMYWDVVARSIGSIEPACIKNMNSAIRYVDQELEKGGKAASDIKQIFLGPVAPETENSNGWFAEVLGYAFYNFQMVGIDEPILEETVWSIRNFCEHMNRDGKLVSPVEGWENAKDSALRRDGEWNARQWASWPGFIEYIKAIGYDCNGYNGAQASCSLRSGTDGADNIAWLWQVCSEWGYYQTGNPGPDQIMSKFSDLEHWKSKCGLNFKDKTAKDWLTEASPDTNLTNIRYGGWDDPQPRTFYTVSENDPWSSLGFLETRFLANKTDAPGLIANSTVPGCDHRPIGKDIFGFVFKDGFHGADLLSVRASQETYPLFASALETWLPCFKRKNNREAGFMEVVKALFRPDPIPSSGGTGNNKTIAAKPKQGRPDNSTVRQLIRVTDLEKKMRLERRARLWSS
ncbi:hypothetical protein TWF718_009898 [Orbilia javanica]|uniref:Serine carboxypeptidase S28-domain-containing protein n=1 Tax=Orbilia javanica TaxID=47235 RepID=A0AAN8MQG4_9PEZI